MPQNDRNVGFLGTGRMATALASGFTRELLTPSQVFGADPLADSRDAFQGAVGSGCVVADNALEGLAKADIVFLAVKPQIMSTALEGIGDVLAGKLIVSIAAGLRINTLEGWLPDSCRVVRVMPNTPCLVGAGACGVSRGPAATDEDEAIVVELLESVGVVETVPERLLDAVTGLSGSGPAYVFQMIEALSDGGVKVGLPRATSTRLAAQTLLGAAKMLLETGEHPGALKDAVTSPGGTTIAAIHEMEIGGVRAALMNAVESSTTRSQELG